VKLRERNTTNDTLALKRTLDASRIGKLSFNARLDGLPFTKESLGNACKDACVAAGILNKSAHELRRAAATRAAENGATAHELMAIFGWTDIKEAEIYTRAADRNVSRHSRRLSSKRERLRSYLPRQDHKTTILSDI